MAPRPHESWGGGIAEGSRDRGRGLLLPAATYQEGAEHGDGGEEVPDVVVVKEVQQDAVPVVLAGLGRHLLRRRATGSVGRRRAAPPPLPWAQRGASPSPGRDGLGAAHLPGAEALEEEEEGEAPHHGGADDAQQGDGLQALAAPELQGKGGVRGQLFASTRSSPRCRGRCPRLPGGGPHGTFMMM